MTSPNPTTTTTNTTLQPPSPLDQLAYTHFLPPNPTTASPETIIFLHGSESCSLEFTRIASLLQPHYSSLLLLDLPGHSRSASIPFTLPDTLARIAHLIGSINPVLVPSGRAHLVGLSLGGFIALEFARQYPELVASVFATGAVPFTGFRHWVNRRVPTMLAAGVAVVGHLGTERVFWRSLGLGDVEPIPGFRDEVRRNQNVRTLKPVFEALGGISAEGGFWEGLRRIGGVRIALVAGGRGDDGEGAREGARVVRGGEESGEGVRREAFVVRDAIHWWSLQFPKVFAYGVKAWVDDRGEMPREYERLV